ncbi:MAG: oxygen-dependent coproporphyrinogen oxidase [Daejeonella sp.]|uniref:oxygen-dependent coproporphyrinogen oxidase n=1 Tax=Daejeonella sp. TaxID=2805397 RepID=UPI002733F11C|nr:oxygen-dependent coproporphyrinogen oxidase [Daejeonella sp.]MDP3468194.1 oxygen-dependent coproporphyrinogen oxidase [Daejeonella sp.]
MITKEKIAEAYQLIQDEICTGLEISDGSAKFQEELWQRNGGGGGRTRIIQSGSVIEKGGVNFSAVYGKLPENIKKAFGVTEDDFFATGVSIVIHPNHPWVPIIHMNIRYFEMTGESGKDLRWFGGGIDLTPHYVIEDDARFFHSALKQTCDRFQSEFYTKFKNWADDYFFIKHRGETRGIGGIFYDRLNPQTTGLDWDDIFEFSLAVGRTFLSVYPELIRRNRNKSFNDEQKKWQMQRRSRYVEFNLVYDAGTKFGLETNGRIESILMSLPPQANWIYDFKASIGSEEEKTLKLLKKEINWVS